MAYKEVGKRILDSYYKTGSIDEKLLEEYRELRSFNHRR